MEALAGLSVAANVMQVIDFTHETVSLFKKIYLAQPIDPHLAGRVAKVQSLTQDLKSKLSQSAAILSQSQNPSISTRLPDLCDDVINTANELHLRLNRPATSKREAVKFTFKTVFRGSSEIVRLDEKLSRLEQTLQTRLLSEIWCQQDAELIQQQQVFKTLDQNVKTLIQQCAQGQIKTQDIIRKDHSEAIAKFSDNLQERLSIGFDRTIQHVTQVAQSSEALQKIRDQKERLLHSVRFEARNARKSAVQTAYEETFEWIFEAPDDDVGSTFRKWLLSDGEPVFWIEGKPGSGKSALMKFLVSSERTVELLDLKYPQHTVYSHFIWILDKVVDGTLRGMLCSLIHQILEVNINDHLLDTLIQDHPKFQRRQSPYDWEMDELKQLLQKLLSLHQGFVVMFIDGLDELDASEDRMHLREFTESTISRARNLKLCISSRPDPKEKLLLSGFPSIRLQDLTAWDLRKVAEEYLSRYFAFSLREISKHQREALVECILGRAEGVFLWVIFALRRLEKGFIAQDTVQKLMDSIQDTPVGLDDLYRSMWDRLGPEKSYYKKDAAFVFKCLLKWGEVTVESMMGHHLTICRDKASGAMFQKLMMGKTYFYQSQEFLNACIHSQRQVETHCAGLVEFLETDAWDFNDELLINNDRSDPRMLKVEFIHRSLREFLLEDGQSLLEQPYMEDVYAAIFNASIGETMSAANLEPARNSRSWSSHFLKESVIEISEQEPWQYHQEKWNLEFRYSLAQALLRCRCWIEYTQRPRKENIEGTSLWESQFQHNFEILKNAFEVSGMTNFLEQLAIYLDYVDPVVGASTLPSLSTYLFWQKLTRDMKFIDRLTQDFRQIFRLINMEWAYPHTVMAGLHAIPQLLTLPESVITNHTRYWKNQEILLLLRHLKQHPNKMMLGSAVLVDDSGEAWEIKCGISLVSTDLTSTYPENWEIIFRINSAAIVNRIITRELARSCQQRYNPWTLPQQTELKGLLYPESECIIEVLLTGYCKNNFQPTSGTVNVLNPMKFQHIADFNPTLTATYEYFFKDGRSRFFAPSKAQSNAILSHLDPDFLMGGLKGPYDVCFCFGCVHGQLENLKAKKKYDLLKQRRKRRGHEIKSIIMEIASGDNERIFNVLDYLRQQGHYIPTEDDLLAFMEAKSTFERVEVLDRLNQEKAEREAWMLKS